jgi:hypothetical protein
MTDTKKEHAGLAAVRSDVGMSQMDAGTQSSLKKYEEVRYVP